MDLKRTCCIINIDCNFCPVITITNRQQTHPIDEIDWIIFYINVWIGAAFRWVHGIKSLNPTVIQPGLSKPNPQHEVVVMAGVTGCLMSLNANISIFVKRMRNSHQHIILIIFFYKFPILKFKGLRVIPVF